MDILSGIYLYIPWLVNTKLIPNYRIMDEEERRALIKKLSAINENLAKNLEEEYVDPYDTTLKRLKHADIELNWNRKRF